MTELNPDTVEWNFEGVDVKAWSHITYQELAPLLDALNNRFVSVSARRRSFDAPAAGPQEVALTIAIAMGTNAVWEVFFAKLAEAAGSRIRCELGKLISRAGENQGGRRFIPLAFRIGAAQLNLQSELTEQELINCFTNAQHPAAELEKHFRDTGPRRPDGVENYIWDRNTGLWIPGTLRIEY